MIRPVAQGRVEPPAALPLVNLEPGHSLLKARIARGEFSAEDYDPRCKYARAFPLVIVKAPAELPRDASGETRVRELVFKQDATAVRLLSHHGRYWAFDTTGLFKHRLVVTGVTKGGTRDLVAIDCTGKQLILNGALPVNEGGFAIAPTTFGTFGGALVAPDELSGTALPLISRTSLASGWPS